MTARQIINQKLFLTAHADARENARRFGMPYRAAFKNALYGARAAAAGFTGDFERWAA